jgi:D-sedoheptulose 7-phosphate isomerase
MNLNNMVSDEIQESISVKKKIFQDIGLQNKIIDLSEMMMDVISSGHKIIFAGNGGSFADAQHLATEFVSRFMTERRPLASIALGTNNSIISAIGNDYGFEKVFSRELLAIGNKGDIFIPISTSGNSHNIIEAVKVANEIGMKVCGLTGISGGGLNVHCDLIRIPSEHTARIQESHILIGHILCLLVERNFLSDE